MSAGTMKAYWSRVHKLRDHYSIPVQVAKRLDKALGASARLDDSRAAHLLREWGVWAPRGVDEHPEPAPDLCRLHGPPVNEKLVWRMVRAILGCGSIQEAERAFKTARDRLESIQ